MHHRLVQRNGEGPFTVETGFLQPVPETRAADMDSEDDWMEDWDGVGHRVVMSIEAVVYLLRSTPPELLHGMTSPWEGEGYPFGKGFLTRSGIQQMLSLGTTLRAHYADMLPKRFSTRLVWAQSTDQPDALLSAQSVLMGLFPDDVNASFPVHTTSHHLDTIMRAADNCPT